MSIICLKQKAKKTLPLDPGGDNRIILAYNRDKNRD
jgi:hypothetical protein